MDKQKLFDLREAYDRQAPQRDAGLIQEWKRKERDDFLSLLKKEGKRSLLEIGAGPGRDGLFFTENSLDVTCIDISPVSVNLCSRKGLKAYVMDVCNMFFADKSFDSAYALNSLLHLEKSEFPGVLRSIEAVLKPAGLFYLGIYGGYDSEGIREDDHTVPKRYFSLFSDDHLYETVSDIFEIMDFRTVSLPDVTEYHFQSLFLRKKPV